MPNTNDSPNGTTNGTSNGAANWIWALLLIIVVIVLIVWLMSVSWGNKVVVTTEEVFISEPIINVTVVRKDQTHPFYNQGSEFGYAINGKQGATLVLKSGQSYTFNINAPDHPFYLSTSKVGDNNAASNIGVPGTPLEMGTFTWTPNSETPQPLWYQCATHEYMGGRVQIR